MEYFTPTRQISCLYYKHSVRGTRIVTVLTETSYCLWYVTLMFLPPFSCMPAVLSLALIAPASFSYSTNAIPRRPGTRRTSRKPSKRPKTLVRASTSVSSGRFWTKRILFGGRYSSGTTAAAAGPVGLRPAPLCVFAGRPDGSPPGAGRLSRCCSASRAFFLSISVEVTR